MQLVLPLFNYLTVLTTYSNVGCSSSSPFHHHYFTNLRADDIKSHHMSDENRTMMAWLHASPLNIFHRGWYDTIQWSTSRMKRCHIFTDQTVRRELRLNIFHSLIYLHVWVTEYIALAYTLCSKKSLWRKSRILEISISIFYHVTHFATTKSTHVGSLYLHRKMLRKYPLIWCKYHSIKSWYCCVK